MRLVRLCVAGCVAILLQAGLAQAGLPGYLLPQLALLVVIQAAFLEHGIQGVVASFLVGLALDFSSALLVGPWAGAFVIVYAGLTILSRGLFVESPLVTVLAAFFSTVAANCFFSVLSPNSDLSVVGHLLHILSQAAVTAACAPFFLPCISYVSERRASPLRRVSSAAPAL
jgi:hypothetical protein